jgi:hypothetical protein
MPSTPAHTTRYGRATRITNGTMRKPTAAALLATGSHSTGRKNPFIA